MKSSEHPLANDDFPLRADGDKLVRKDGSEVARVSSAAVAKDIADRLNRDQLKHQEDVWSA
jgi:hypothetical protein